jgi:hypothetical protein
VAHVAHRRPGTTINTTRRQLVPIAMADDLATARLTGTYMKPWSA